MALDHEKVHKVAELYTKAWCSRSGNEVATFFTEDATSIINAGEPTIGRPAISEAMGAFFTDFPDLVLTMDELRCGGSQAIFLWTLEGTNSGPGGTGNFVRLSGWQNWMLTDDLLIKKADGGYDAEEYDRQVREGI
ncbi:MAG: SgcJ/EcaC family oxidoreductase [Hyphomicrobiales bacterium]